MSARNEWVRPAARGLGTGVVAWVLGYLVTYLLQAENVTNTFTTDLLEWLADEPVTWKLVGWLYYNAQFVDVITPGFFGRNAVNYLSGAEELTLTGLFALVPALLLLGGLVAAWGAAALGDGARSGVMVVLGYFPATLAGAIVVRVSVGDAVAGPDLVTAALLAGLVYPLLFGALGGVVGQQLSARLGA